MEIGAFFGGASMAGFRTQAYFALVEALISQRRARKLALRKVVALMPEWLEWDHSTLHKIEKGKRDISFVEARALAIVLGTTIAELDAQATALIAALRNQVVPADAPPRRKAKRPGSRKRTGSHGGG
jgi:hypothetical protein